MRALTDDLSLADLLEAASRLRRTLTLDLRTPEGSGRIYVSMGDIVHANYDELIGQEAIDAFLAAPELEYSALPDARALFGLRAALEHDSPMPPPSSNGRRTMESSDSARSVAVRSTPPPLQGLPPLPHLPRMPLPPPPASGSRVTAIVHRPSFRFRRATTGRPRWMTVLAVVGFSAVLGIGTGLALDQLSAPPAGAAVAKAPPPPSVPSRPAAAPVDLRPEILREVPPCAPPAASAEFIDRLVFRPASTFLDPPTVAQLRALSVTLKRAGHRALIVGHASRGAAKQENERLTAVRVGLVADELRRLGVPRGLYDLSAVVTTPPPATPGGDAGGFVEVRLTELALATAQGGSRRVE